MGLLDCNCSLLGDATTREAVLVDPGGDVDTIMAMIIRHHAKVTKVPFCVYVVYMCVYVCVFEMNANMIVGV